MSISQEEMNEIRKDHRQTGERLASIETILHTVARDLKEIKDDLKLKASTTELEVCHERINKCKEDIDELENKVDELGKDVATLKTHRKSDFKWMAIITSGVSFIVAAAIAIAAALIQKGG